VKLFSEKNRSIPTCVKNRPERHRRPDGQTTYCGITALCVASRSKNLWSRTRKSNVLLVTYFCYDMTILWPTYVWRH